MSIPRTYVFVDGENLVMRYQAMVADGFKPRKGVVHVPDVFVWHPGITTWDCVNIARAYYYTSATGDSQRIVELRKKIAGTLYSFSFERSTFPVADGEAQLVPRIFHKSSQSRKTRNVDINIVIDVMRAGHLDNIDLIYLVSGDGDYMPLIEEVMRLGKEVNLSAFSSGLNEALVSSVDDFYSLDDVFFLRRGV